MEEKFNMLENCSESILVTYKKLYEMELANLKKTVTYEEVLRILRKAMNIEKAIIDGLTDEELVFALSHFANKYHKQIILVIDPNAKDDELKKIRIINTLYSAFSDRNSSLSIPNFKIGMYVDHLLLTLSICEQSTHEYIHKEKTKRKYTLSMSIPELENILIKNNFDISMHPYITYNMLLFTDGIRKEGTKFTNITMIQILFMYLKSIFDLPNDFRKNSTDYSNFVFGVASIRSTLLLMDNDLKEFLAETILKIINSNNNIEIPKNLNIEENLVTDFIKETKESFKNCKNKEYSSVVLKRILSEHERDKRIPQYVTIGR